MYICDDCDSIFEEPRVIRERIEHLPDIGEEYVVAECHECGSGHFKIARECACGEFMHGSNVMCKACRKTLSTRIKMAINALCLSADEMAQIDEWWSDYGLERIDEWQE